MIKGFGGLIISSKDPEALAKFYNEKLGIPILGKYSDNCIELGFNKNETAVWIGDENKYGKTYDGMLAFVLRCDSIDKTYEELTQKGVQLEPPTVAEYGGKELVCKDLENNAIIVLEQ